MDLREGFRLDDPPVFVPWAVTDAGLRRLLSERGLRHVPKGYYVLSGCQSLGGLRCELGFHFVPRGGDRLEELEFFRRSYADQAASFHEFQVYFEAAFGPPTSTRAGPEGFPTHEWVLPGARIIHLVQDRFGPEEHMRIRRLGA